MNILIAPNAFKNSLDAVVAANAIAAGLKRSGLKCTCHKFPVGDGGDGTGDLLIQHLNGKTIEVRVHNALGGEITASFGLIDDGKTAVIEMAKASGIGLLHPNELKPLLASTYGTGELIKAALDEGVKKIIIGMGGSATIDGGAGILNALGVRFLNVDGDTVQPSPMHLAEIAVIDASGLDERAKDCELIILCDVDNPLIGPNGAAAVFGPQKGADKVDVMLLEGWLKWFALLAKEQTGKEITNLKHAGTAGGAAAGLHAFLNAKLVSGAQQFLALTNFNSALNKADLVITAEGAIDEQTLQGKAPAAVAQLARKKGIKVIALGGKVPQDPSAAMTALFDELICINPLNTNVASAIKNTYINIEQTAFELGSRLC